MKKFLFFSLAIVLFSCDSNRLFEEDKTFEDRYWGSNETLTFNFKIDNTEGPYNLYYNIRNSLEFPYARLFVKYSLTDSAGTELANKLDAQYLFDQKTGKPFGKSGIGDIYDHRFLILSNYKFTHPGNYRFDLTQYNRQDSLRGILAAGIRIERVEK
jgi:gliding motility-associated lipoprotein GldH